MSLPEELQQRLQERRSFVDAEGQLYETRPDDSTADAGTPSGASRSPSDGHALAIGVSCQPCRGAMASVLSVRLHSYP